MEEIMLNIKRIISVAATVSLLGTVACGNEPTKDSETTTDNTAENSEAVTEVKSYTMQNVFPEDLDFGNIDITFLLEGTWQGNEIVESPIYAESENGDVVNDAVFNRNQDINEYLGVNIKLAESVGANTMSKRVEQSVLAGDNEFDIIGAYQVYSLSLAAQNYLTPLENSEYLHIDRNYWPSDYLNAFNYAHTYWLTGDLTTMFTGGKRCMFVNSRIWQDLYQDRDLYAIVQDGKWTIDTLIQMIKDYSADMDSNGKYDPAVDKVGLQHSIGSELFFMSAGGRYSETVNGDIQITIKSEKSVDIFNKIYTLINETPGVYYNSSNTDRYTTFANCTIFTTDGTLLNAQELRGMKDDFAIIPSPKFNEAQEKYITNITDNVTTFGIPVTNTEKFDASTAVLEAMEIISHSTLTPAYYESALKIKYTRDENSAKMIDIISDCVTTDFALIYSEPIGGGIGTTGDGIARIIRNALNDKNSNIISQIDSKMPAIEQHLAELLSGLAG